MKRKLPLKDREPTSYCIMISEPQRAVIQRALEAIDHVAMSHVVPMEPQEIAELREMIRDLPRVERAHPSTLHGLCL